MNVLLLFRSTREVIKAEGLCRGAGLACLSALGAGSKQVLGESLQVGWRRPNRP